MTLLRDMLALMLEGSKWLLVNLQDSTQLDVVPTFASVCYPIFLQTQCTHVVAVPGIPPVRSEAEL